MNSRLSPVWAAILSLVLAVPAVAGQGIVTIYGVASNGGSPPTYTCNVSSSAGITVGDHVMAKTTSAGATGVWLVTAKPSATSVTLQDSLTQETGTAFGAPLANVTNGLAYGTPESGTTMIPDGASWWAAAARRNYVVLAEAAPSGAALTRVDDTNVTLTLGGTPGTALLQATSLTLGWTGTLAESRGGTGASSLSAGLDAAFGSTRGSILYRGASGWVILAPGTSGYALVSNGAGADPSYQTVTSPTPGWDDVLAVDAGTGANNPTVASGQRVIFARASSNGVSLSSAGTRTLTLANEAGTSASTTLQSLSGLSITAAGAGVTLDATAGDLVSTAAGEVDFTAGTQVVLQGGGSPVVTIGTTETTIGGGVLRLPTGDGGGALVVGTADTNGIRLDLETGTLAVREGDDSAYGPVAALDLSLSGTSLNCNGTASITGYKLSTSANTGDSALAVTQAGRIQTNEGAVGAVNLTLPTATATTGYVYEAVVQANQYLRFTAATGNTIRDGATVSAAAGYIRSTTIGSTIRIYCINATEWIVLSKTGTWTVDS